MHCIIPGGGITKAGKWKTTCNNGKFLFPVKALSLVFRARYVAALRKVLPDESKEFYQSLFSTNWVVYAKRPFGGPFQVIEYLSRYTHKIAISNHRFTNIGNYTVSFAYKDYRHAGNKKEMTLDALEFIRRFAMHILPKGFVRIRHYGMLSNKVKPTAVPLIREQLQPGLNQIKDVDPPAIKTATAPTCPCCKKGLMQIVMHFDYRGPPAYILKRFERMENTGPLQLAV